MAMDRTLAMKGCMSAGTRLAIAHASGGAIKAPSKALEMITSQLSP